MLMDIDVRLAREVVQMESGKDNAARFARFDDDDEAVRFCILVCSVPQSLWYAEMRQNRERPVRVGQRRWEML